MTRKQQHEEQWLDGAIHHVSLLCQQAANCQDEYVVPGDATIKSAVILMTELRLAHCPKIALTQDGEIVLTWEHTGDRFKAIAKCNGSVVLYQNKKIIETEVFRRRLTSVPA